MIIPSVRFLHAIEKDNQTPETRTLIMMHELGGIANRLSKARRLDDKTYLADIIIDIGQLIVQAKMLALDLNLPPEDCEKVGIETTLQHFEEWWG
jgi:hypothetical protein